MADKEFLDIDGLKVLVNEVQDLVEASAPKMIIIEDEKKEA